MDKRAKVGKVEKNGTRHTARSTALDSHHPETNMCVYLDESGEEPAGATAASFHIKPAGRAPPASQSQTRSASCQIRRKVARLPRPGGWKSDSPTWQQVSAGNAYLSFPSDDQDAKKRPELPLPSHAAAGRKAAEAAEVAASQLMRFTVKFN